MEDFACWLGAPLATFKVVYKFNGELSEDVFPETLGGNHTPGWTQQHNPFLGGTGPPTFLQGWEEWHALMFDTDPHIHDADFSPEILYAVSETKPKSLGIVFVIERGFTTAPAYLRAMANELQIPPTSLTEMGVGYGEFSLHGFSNTRKHIREACETDAFSACVMKLPPSDFSVSKSYDCCDGHRVVSYLAKAVKRDGVNAIAAHAPPFFLRPLASPMQAACHMTFHELDYGRYYKKIMRTPVSRLLRTALKTLSVPSSCSSESFSAHLRRNGVVEIFQALQTPARMEFFSCNGSQLRIAKFYRVWLECLYADGLSCGVGAWAGSLQRLFYTAVPFDLSEMFAERFRFSFKSSPPCASAERKILFRTTPYVCYLACKRAVTGVLTAVLNKIGCAFALQRIFEFSEPRRLACFTRWNGVCSEGPCDAFDGALSYFLNWNDESAVTELVFRDLNRMKMRGSMDARIPVALATCIAEADGGGEDLESTQCWKLLKAGANPTVLLEGIKRSDGNDADTQLAFAAICFFITKTLPTDGGLQVLRRAVCSLVASHGRALRSADAAKILKF